MKVINLFGGPGSGKSTVQAGLFYTMKENHLRVEMVMEVAKDIVYSKTTHLLTENQIAIFAEQNRRQVILQDKVDWAITDCPLLLNSIYGTNELHSYHEFVIDTFCSYDNINIFLDRPHLYSKEGRVQDLTQAKEVDGKILDLLHKNDIPIHFRLDTDRSTVDQIWTLIVTEHMR